MDTGIPKLGLLFACFLTALIFSCHEVRKDVIARTEATLRWEDTSSNELGFKIERKTGSGGTYREIVTVGSNVTSYTDTGLSKGTTYYYRVRAYNSSGHSPYSPEISIETSSD